MSSHLSGHSFQDNVRYPVGIQPRKKKSNNLKEKKKKKTLKTHWTLHNHHPLTMLKECVFLKVHQYGSKSPALK